MQSVFSVQSDLYKIIAFCANLIFVKSVCAESIFCIKCFLCNVLCVKGAFLWKLLVLPSIFVQRTMCAKYFLCKVFLGKELLVQNLFLCKLIFVYRDFYEKFFFCVHILQYSRRRQGTKLMVTTCLPSPCWGVLAMDSHPYLSTRIFFIRKCKFGLRLGGS